MSLPAPNAPVPYVDQLRASLSPSPPISLPLSPPDPSIRFISDISVEVIAQCGSDELIAHAAWVSTGNGPPMPRPSLPLSTIPSPPTHSPEDKVHGLLGYLLKQRHGSPFEHGFLCIRVHAPIFVWREWHRHRIGFSYNEESARYKVLEPVFYIPPRHRPMMKVENWKPGRPKFYPADLLDEKGRHITFGPYPGPDAKYPATWETLTDNLKVSYRQAYDTYLQNLELGIDPGLARDCLPVGIYSSCYVSCNPRSIMAFLSLRTHHPEATQVSYPLYEIEVAAKKLESIFAQYWPSTYQHFVANGRTAP